MFATAKHSGQIWAAAMTKLKSFKTRRPRSSPRWSTPTLNVFTRRPILPLPPKSERTEIVESKPVLSKIMTWRWSEFTDGNLINEIQSFLNFFIVSIGSTLTRMRQKVSLKDAYIVKLVTVVFTPTFTKSRGYIAKIYVNHVIMIL
jgi:hypothetical protein